MAAAEIFASAKGLTHSNLRHINPGHTGVSERGRTAGRTPQPRGCEVRPPHAASNVLMRHGAYATRINATQSPFEAAPRSEAAQDPIVPPRNPGWRTVHTGSPIGTVKISSNTAVTLPVLTPDMRGPGGMK